MQLESEAYLQAESLMVMAMLAMHPRPHQVMRRFRDLLEACRTDPSDDGIIQRLQARAGHVPSTLEQLLHELHCAELAPDADGGEQRGYDYQHMHDLFLAALLSAHPEPRLIRGQFRTLLAGLTASHARYAFDESFLLAIRRSALRLDRMMELVISAQETRVTAQETTGSVLGQTLPRADATSGATAAS